MLVDVLAGGVMYAFRAVLGSGGFLPSFLHGHPLCYIAGDADAAKGRVAGLTDL